MPPEQRVTDGSKPIENLRLGDLVLTHHNRFMPIVECAEWDYDGEILEVHAGNPETVLCLTPNQLIAIPAEPLPPTYAGLATSRLLRKRATPAEAKLWSLLRGRQIGAKFRRQHRMGSFILDFYAPEVRLAVEVEGGIHNTTDQIAYDQFRDDIIARHDVRVLRISNSQIEQDPVGVVHQIAVETAHRRVRFDHRVAWWRADELKSGTPLLNLGESRLRRVISVHRLQVAETLCALRVSEDGSFVTEVGILRGLQ